MVELTVNSVNDVQQVAEGFLGGNVEAIFIPTDNIIASSIPTLMSVANKEKIPVFGAEVGHVKSGVLASESISSMILESEQVKWPQISLKGKSR